MLFIFNLLISSFVGFSQPQITPISDGEFNMDTSACWLKNSNDEIIFYDDFNTGRIKMDSKIIEFKGKKTLPKKGFACGKKYKYKNDTDTISIEMSKPKEMQCKGKIRLTTKTGHTQIKDLYSECGE